MAARLLYHGTNGDAILGIIESRAIKPNQGRIFFSEWNWQSVLMHGADSQRKAAFAVKVEVQIADDVASFVTGTAGVADTLVVMTTRPLPAEVLELYIRRPTPDGMEIEHIAGARPIRTFLLGAAAEGT
jgi:hypothetical protein